MDRMQVLLALRTAVASTDADRFALIAASTHPADIATSLADLDPGAVYTLLAGLPIRAAICRSIMATANRGRARKCDEAARPPLARLDSRRRHA